jgi:hypothetical protein
MAAEWAMCGLYTKVAGFPRSFEHAAGMTGIGKRIL